MAARTTAARRTATAVGALSRALRVGGGSTVGGRVGLALDPGLLTALSRGREIALVSGTNGKTTTTRLLAEALGGPGEVATSLAGANMPGGIVAALASARDGVPAVLEVDEGYLRGVARAVRPRVVVALNLSRDQLDRVGEVRMVASRWRDAFAEAEATVVANCDDPLVAWAAGASRDVVWVGAGGLWTDDAHHCPVCDSEVRFTGPPEGGGWSCACGFARPRPDALVEDGVLSYRGRSVRLDVSLPGRFNTANAAMAVVAAAVLGRDPAGAARAVARVEEVAGRFSTVRVGRVEVRLLLAKNPAGWSELLDMVASGGRPVVVAINARDADGHDPSWLWDVPFERLSGVEVVATGERRLDLAVRLRYAGVAHRVVADQVAAVEAAGARHGPGAVDYVGNYTAFQQLRVALRRSARPSPATALPDSPHVPPGPAVPARPPARATAGDGPATGDGGGAGPLESAPPPGRGRARRDALSVVVVHPDLLGTYGDGGNGAVLAARAAWRGIPVDLLLVSSDAPLPSGADLYCLGGGEDGPQARSAELLRGGALPAAVSRGATVLAVCAGFQIVGTSFAGPDGTTVPGVGLVDATTARGTGPRAVGEVVLESVEHATRDGGLSIGSGELVTGFENHAGVTRLGPGLAPLGLVRSGTGNGAGAPGRPEGAVSGHVVCTYLHGPVLARNPALADRLVAAATGAAPEPLDDSEELLLRAECLARAARPRRLRAGRLLRIR